MKTFTTNSGVNCFETGGPDGLVRVEAGSPLSTDDPAVIAILEEAGAHAVTTDAAAVVSVDKTRHADPVSAVKKGADES